MNIFSTQVINYCNSIGTPTWGKKAWPPRNCAAQAPPGLAANASFKPGRPLVSSCLRHADAAWHGPQAKGVYIGQSVSAAMPLPRVWLWRLPLRVADTLWAGQVAEPFRDVCKTVQHALATLRLRFNQGPQAFSIYTVTVFGLDAFQRNSWSICCWPVHALEAKSTSGSCLRTYPVYSKSLGLSTRRLPRLPQKRKASSKMGTSLVV